jgi:hypothetical protein
VIESFPLSTEDRISRKSKDKDDFSKGPLHFIRDIVTPPSIVCNSLLFVICVLIGTPFLAFGNSIFEI